MLQLLADGQGIGGSEENLPDGTGFQLDWGA